MLEVNKETPAIEIYKGYTIETRKNGNGLTSLVMKDGEFVAATFSLLDKLTSVEKAKAKIDKF